MIKSLYTRNCWVKFIFVHITNIEKTIFKSHCGIIWIPLKEQNVEECVMHTFYYIIKRKQIWLGRLSYIHYMPYFFCWLCPYIDHLEYMYVKYTHCINALVWRFELWLQHCYFLGYSQIMMKNVPILGVVILWENMFAAISLKITCCRGFDVIE